MTKPPVRAKHGLAIMRIQRKVVNQLLLSSDEVASLLGLIEAAKHGKTVHYAERRMDNGSYFGIGVDIPEEPNRRFGDDYPTAQAEKY
jgi:hypothetical protein